jgi:phosphoesterase RecJ-like protein
VSGRLPMPLAIPAIVNIDHHITNTRFGHYQLVDVNACATSEILSADRAMDIEMDTAIATAIYTGILTDTGSFGFPTPTRLLSPFVKPWWRMGVKPSQVAQHVYGTYSLGRIKLLNLALDSIEISNNGQLSIMTVTREMLADTETQAEDADGLINYARRIQDVKVAALIHELENGNGNSGRPKTVPCKPAFGRQRGCLRIAMGFGGGGHAGAAGFSVESSLPN